MASGCGDVLSLQDLKVAKLHQIFEAEVITGLAGGVAGGANIDYATNLNTGQVQKTMPAILRDIGYQPASFDFVSGGTLTVGDRNKAVLWPVSGGGDGDFYFWEGALPKVIPASSSPSSTGGVADGAWRPVGDISLRADFETFVADLMSGADGKGDAMMAVRANYLWGKVRTQHEKNADSVNLRDAIGVDPTGVTDSTTAIQDCLNSFGVTGGVVHIANGDKFLCGSLTIPQNVTLLGALHTPGEVKQSLSQSYYSFGSQLRLKTGATIKSDRGAAVKNIIAIRDGLNLSPTTDAAAAALVASFSGTAFTSLDPDVTYENVLVLGFEYAYRSAPTTPDTGRANFINFHFDCTHGIRKEYSVDIDRFYGIHGWPYLTAHIPTVTAASSLSRSGIGLYFKNVADWTQVFGAFTYGYAQGCVLDAVWNCQLNNCGFDACGTTGVSVVGASRFNRMNNTFINSNTTCVSVDVSGTNPDFKTTNCVFNGVTNGVYVTNGSYFSLGDTFMGGSGVSFTDGTISGSVVDAYFDGCAAPFNITAVASRVVTVSNIKYSATQPTITQTEKRFATATALYDRRPLAAGVGHVLEQGGTTSAGYPVGLFRCAPRLVNGTVGSENSNYVWTQYYAGAWIDRLVLGAASFNPAGDNVLSNGTTSLRWTQVCAVNSTIATSDGRLKKDKKPIDDKVLDAWEKVKFVQYRRDEKGMEDETVHFGVIAQQVVEAFASVGLNAEDYYVVRFDGDKYGVVYEEALIIEAAMVRRKLGL